MLTSHVPLLEGDSQQLTVYGKQDRSVTRSVCAERRMLHVARERDIALVLARIMPFEHGEGLTDWECPQGILERDDCLGSAQTRQRWDAS